jgi:hypothetical protein
LSGVWYITFKLIGTAIGILINTSGAFFIMDVITEPKVPA